jgi:hypothetical protein
MARKRKARSENRLVAIILVIISFVSILFMLGITVFYTPDTIGRILLLLLLALLFVDVPGTYVFLKVRQRLIKSKQLRMLKHEDIDAVSRHRLGYYIARLLDYQRYKTIFTRNSDDSGADNYRTENR